MVWEGGAFFNIKVNVKEDCQLRGHSVDWIVSGLREWRESEIVLRDCSFHETFDTSGNNILVYIANIYYTKNKYLVLTPGSCICWVCG